MAYVTIENDVVTGVFAVPQDHLDGFQEIDDSDPRIADFWERMKTPPAPPTEAELQDQLSQIAAQLGLKLVQA